VSEKIGDGFSVVCTADGLGQDWCNINGLDLGAQSLLLLVRTRVCDLHERLNQSRSGIREEQGSSDHNGFNLGGVQLVYSRATEDSWTTITETSSE
jgi:hypothetical protein